MSLVNSSLLQRWNAAEEKRLKQESELQSFLLTLLDEHRKQYACNVHVLFHPCKLLHKRIAIRKQICVDILLCRKLSEVEVAGPPETTETLINKINSEHVSISHVLLVLIAFC